MYNIQADEVANHIQHQLAPDSWMIFHAKSYSKTALIFYGIAYFILFPMICTVGLGLVFWYWIQPELLTSSIWPMYTTYPILTIPVLAFPLLVVRLVWWLEYRDRNTLIAILPEGFIQYKPWQSEHKRKAKVIEFANVKKITTRTRLAGIVLTITKKDGIQEKVFITRKYDDEDSPEATVHLDIARHIEDSWRKFQQQKAMQSRG